MWSVLSYVIYMWCHWPAWNCVSVQQMSYFIFSRRYNLARLQQHLKGSPKRDHDLICTFDRIVVLWAMWLPKKMGGHIILVFQRKFQWHVRREVPSSGIIVSKLNCRQRAELSSHRVTPVWGHYHCPTLLLVPLCKLKTHTTVHTYTHNCSECISIIRYCMF